MIEWGKGQGLLVTYWISVISSPFLPSPRGQRTVPWFRRVPESRPPSCKVPGENGGRAPSAVHCLWLRPQLCLGRCADNSSDCILEKPSSVQLLRVLLWLRTVNRMDGWFEVHVCLLFRLQAALRSNRLTAERYPFFTIAACSRRS